MVYMKGCVIWLAIIFAESVHGTLRGLFLAPRVGDFRARQIAVFTGALIIFAIAFFSVRWMRATRSRELAAVGLIWTVLTVAFEIALGRFVLDVPWERILSDYNLCRGGLLPLGLLFMAAAPLIAGRLRGITGKK